MTAIATGRKEPKKGSSRTGLWALLAKAGPKFMSVMVKLAKVLKVGKVALAAGSFAAYALLFSWKFALVLMGSLLFHEYGHIWAMKRHGLKTKGVYFIPLLGAAAVSEDLFPSRKAELEIALMGPVWGFLLALATFGVYAWTHRPVFAAMASWMAMLNLFNLLPINPLDGGRVMKSIAYSISSRLGLWFLIAGIFGAFLLAWELNLGLIVFLTFIGALELLMEVKALRREKDKERIIKALAPALGVPATREAVAAAIKPTVAFEGLSTDLIDAYRTRAWEMTDLARAQRVPHKTVFRRETAFATKDEECRVWAFVSNDLEEQGLSVFLSSKWMPRMTGRQGSLGLAAYLLLATSLGGLMYAVAHVPAAAAALQVFTS